MPVSMIRLYPTIVTQVKNQKKDGYQAIQFGLGSKTFKKATKSLQGHVKGAKLDQAPLYLHEVRAQDIKKYKVGDKISPAQVLKAGDLVSVRGRSKGKGFTGVMKRWNFAGGPRTHGQSDRQRAPGSIGQATTPGRVFKGKKMAGRSGGAKTTIRNLVVLEIDEEKNLVLIKGLVPGARGSWVEISGVGKAKKFSPLLEKGEKLKIFKAEKKGTASAEVAASQGKNAEN